MLFTLIMNTFYEKFSNVESRLEEDVQPSVIEKKEDANKKVIQEKFANDIMSLEKFIGKPLVHGTCITLSLEEILSILPRNRKRRDAYDSLKRYLHMEMGVELNIYSRKEKK